MTLLVGANQASYYVLRTASRGSPESADGKLGECRPGLCGAVCKRPAGVRLTLTMDLSGEFVAATEGRRNARWPACAACLRDATRPPGIRAA